MIQRVIAIALLIITSPLFAILYLAVKFSSTGPFLFNQKRMGKNKTPFTIYKIRTMIENAENVKNEYYDLNEANGPVFKIRNDPRYTRFGKFLSHTGLDELPQLFNILKGDMAFVGPRPLPIEEAKKIPKKYQKRFEVLPGITSLWVIKGAHSLSFTQWMQFDVWYVNHKSLWIDLKIALHTTIFLINVLFFRIINISQPLMELFRHTYIKHIINLAILLLCLLSLYQLFIRGVHSFVEYDEGYNLLVSVNLHISKEYATFDTLFDPFISTGPTLLIPTALFVNTSFPLLVRIPVILFSLLFIIFVSTYVLRSKIQIILFLILINILPYFFYYSTHVVGEIPAIFFSLISFFYLTKKKFFLSGIFFSLSVLTKNVFVLSIIPIGLMMISNHHVHNQKNVRIIFQFLIGLLSVFAIWEMYKFLSLLSTGHDYIASLQNHYSVSQLLAQPRTDLIHWRMNIIRAAFFSNPFFVVITYSAISIYILSIKQKNLYLIKLISLFGSIYTVYFIFFGTINFYYRHLLPSLVLFITVLPFFIEHFFKQFTDFKKNVVIIFLMGYVMMNYSYILYPLVNYRALLITDEYQWSFYSHSQLLNEQLEAASYIKENIKPNAVLTGIGWWNAPEISFLAQRKIYRDPSKHDKYYFIQQFYGEVLDKKYKDSIPDNLTPIFHNEHYVIYKNF